MSILNKKGQDIQLNWVVGTLSGVLIGSILLAIGLQWYITTTKTEDSFDALIAKLESLKDKESTSMAYFLPDGYVLVSFSGGKDFDTTKDDIVGRDLISEESCFGKIKVPKACGSEDCLCVCDGSYEYGYEDACIEDPLVCYPFTSAATKDLSVSDHGCSTGVYRPGPDNGIFSLYLVRTGNNIEFCSVEGCVTQEQKLAVDATDNLVSTYNTCTEKRDDCACAIDWTFFEANPYALHFEGTAVSLLDFTTNKEIYTATLSSSATTKVSGFSSDIYLYNYEYVPISGQGYTKFNDLVISPSKETIILSSSDQATTQITLSESLVKTTSSLAFVEPSYNFTTLPSCTQTETVSDQEIKLA
ncbi:hypothetical protein EXS74_02735 [Candidatus Woesearchaeota archaeon]|nr:hypothetical protein [Candidatus Woesearchaeota archaeon]